MNILLALGLALPTALLGWPHLGDAARGWRDVVETSGRVPPLVRAPDGPIKISPSLEMAGYERDPVRGILDGAESFELELLDAPEQPILPPATPEPEQVAQGAVERDQRGDVSPGVTQVSVLQEEPPQPDARLHLETPPSIVRPATFSEPSDEGEQGPPPLVSFDEASGSAPGERVYRIQVAALPSQSEAELAWASHRRAHADVLSDLAPVIERGETGAYTFFRVQAGTFTRLAEAQEACTWLAQRGADCVVVRR